MESGKLKIIGVPNVGQGSIPSQCEGNVAKRQRETASVRGAPTLQ